MKKRIEVRSQHEFDVCIAAGNVAIVIGCIVVAWENSSVEAWENSSVVARGNSSVVARENSSVVARENSSVVARENSSVEAWENSSVEAWENSSVEAWGNSSVVAWGNSSVEARGNSSVVAWENSSVEARENSSVEAWGNVFIRLFSAIRIKASASVVVMMHGEAKSLSGGRKLKAAKPKTAKAWCAHWGVEVKKDVALLYKAVNADYNSPRGMSYAPGSIPVAPDWDGGKAECGGGLHFSPSPAMARSFHSGAKRYMACPVALSDIAVHPDGDYTEKVKARGCCSPCFEVDKHGKPISD